jgi:2-phosphoglycerate kinase
MESKIIGISGPTGCGKSTVATELAHRLDIVRIVSTDMVREVMRATLSPAVAPLLHKSSFELVDVEEFYEQARLVSVGLQGVVDRARREKLSMIIEGVHLVPGDWKLDHHYMLMIKSADRHKDYLETRSEETKGARPVEKYLDHFGRIRKIQESLVFDVPYGMRTIENSDMETTVERIIGYINDQSV